MRHVSNRCLGHNWIIYIRCCKNNTLYLDASSAPCSTQRYNPRASLMTQSVRLALCVIQDRVRDVIKRSMHPTSHATFSISLTIQTERACPWNIYKPPDVLSTSWSIPRGVVGWIILEMDVSRSVFFSLVRFNPFLFHYCSVDFNEFNFRYFLFFYTANSIIVFLHFYYDCSF